MELSDEYCHGVENLAEYIITHNALNFDTFFICKFLSIVDISQPANIPDRT